MEENPLLKTIEPSAFDHLSDLRYLSLKHNALTVPSSAAGNFFLPFLGLVRICLQNLILEVSFNSPPS